MKPALPAPTSFNASLVLPLLPIFLLGAAIVSGSKKTLVTEAARHDYAAKVAAEETAPKGLPFGKFRVTRTSDILFKDTNRSKDIPVTVTAPEGDGPFPVIVFSHRTGGDGTQSEALLRWWASHGYIVISPTHSDSIRWQQQRSDLCDPNDDDVEEGSIDLQNMVRLTSRDPQAGVQRARDISFVLDSLGRIEEHIPSLAGKIDDTRIGVSGNSLGAYTAQLIGGATVSVPETAGKMSFRDPRAKAILQFSGYGAGQRGLTRKSWKTFSIPMMTVTGSEDRSLGYGPEWKRDAFTFSPAAGNKYYVFIKGAHQGSFGGRFASSRRSDRQSASKGDTGNPADQKAIFSYIEQTSLAFWDMTLKGDTAAKVLLEKESASLAKERGVHATVDYK